MNAGVTSQKTKKKYTGRYIFERIKESKWGTSCISILIKRL